MATGGAHDRAAVFFSSVSTDAPAPSERVTPRSEPCPPVRNVAGIF
jgi:hypothetical protein